MINDLDDEDSEYNRMINSRYFLECVVQTDSPSFGVTDYEVRVRN